MGCRGRSVGLRDTTDSEIGCQLWLTRVASGSREGGEKANLVHHIFQRVRAVDSEADKDEIGFRVRERAQPIVLFLSCRIPQRELHCLTSGRVCWVRDVVLEYGWNIFLRKSEPSGIHFETMQISEGEGCGVRFIRPCYSKTVLTSGK